MTAVSRHAGRLEKLETDGQCRFMAVDLTRADDVMDAVNRVEPDVVYHFASHPDGPENYQHALTAVHTNLLGTLNLLEAMRQVGGGALVYGDSCKVYGNAAVPYRSDTPLSPDSSYSITKAAGWQLCQLYCRVHGLAAISIRPTLMYGPHQGRNLISFVIRSVLEGKTSVRLDGGSQTRDPVYVEDGVSAFVAAGGAAKKLSGKVINIGGGQELSVTAIARAIVDVMGARTEIVSCAEQARATEMWRSCCDNREAAELLDWRPSHTLETGLQATVAYETARHVG